MTQIAPESILAHRLSGLDAWLEEEAPYAQFDQLHLDRGTPERAYWHLGYRAALRDVLELLKDGTGNSGGIASLSPADDQGA